MAPSRPLEYNALLLERENPTPHLSIFHVRYDEPLDRSFEPGQYVALGLNNEEQPELGAVRRSMSIVSAPAQGDTLQFFVRFVQNPESPNPLTHLLWKLNAGDRLFLTRKPVGKFTLSDTVGESDSRVKILVAAGTGIAPFVSMIRDRVLRDPAVDCSDILLLQGASYPADLVYREELERSAANNHLRYVPTISRPSEAPDWSGATGRVEDLLDPDRLRQLEENLGLPCLSPKNAAILICGLQGTIANTILRSANRGFVPFDRKIRKALEFDDTVESNIWWEQYDTEPVLNIADTEAVRTLRQTILAGQKNHA